MLQVGPFDYGQARARQEHQGRARRIRPGRLLAWSFAELTSRLPSPAYLTAVPQHLRTKLTRPLPIKDGGVLHAVEDVPAYMTGRRLEVAHRFSKGRIIARALVSRLAHSRYFHATSKPNRCDPYATLRDF